MDLAGLELFNFLRQCCLGQTTLRNTVSEREPFIQAQLPPRELSGTHRGAVSRTASPPVTLLKTPLL